MNHKTGFDNFKSEGREAEMRAKCGFLERRNGYGLKLSIDSDVKPARIAKQPD